MSSGWEWWRWLCVCTFTHVYPTVASQINNKETLTIKKNYMHSSSSLHFPFGKSPLFFLLDGGVLNIFIHMPFLYRFLSWHSLFHPAWMPINETNRSFFWTASSRTMSQEDEVKSQKSTCNKAANKCHWEIKKAELLSALQSCVLSCQKGSFSSLTPEHHGWG